MRKNVAAIIMALTMVFAPLALATDYEVAESTQTVSKVLQSAATTGNGHTWNLKGNKGNVWVDIDWTVGTSAGTVVIETSDSAAGPWQTFQTLAVGSLHSAPLAAAASDRVDLGMRVQVIRCRISVTVADGTVTCTVYAR